MRTTILLLLAACTTSRDVDTACVDGPIGAGEPLRLTIHTFLDADQAVTKDACVLAKDDDARRVEMTNLIRYAPDRSPFAEISLAVFGTFDCVGPPLEAGSWTLAWGEDTLAIEVPDAREHPGCLSAFDPEGHPDTADPFVR